MAFWYFRFKLSSRIASASAATPAAPLSHILEELWTSRRRLRLLGLDRERLLRHARGGHDTGRRAARLDDDPLTSPALVPSPPSPRAPARPGGLTSSPLPDGLAFSCASSSLLRLLGLLVITRKMTRLL